jgi:heat shock protein HslJ
MMWAAGANENCEVPPEIVFGKDGKVSGNAACNDLSGEWKLEGKKISLAGVRAEGRKCGPKITEVEQKFMEALHAAAYAAADGDKVRLFDAEGRELIVLVPSSAGACL